ncbi:cupredoxin domain-containing protein [Anaeromyxobacter diazotrophicus]|uniref:Cytochrome oxidase subunit II copper A binding domain-containing protein n=1 Tax=Anaeromyxobacter diazotrophicus TaxID=2590199 RepID=A0A7I9VHR8_9BACT|nr:cupredoxin domain-containing protein [Anaeromyxobacter diazotrophicus]GEJ55779.1 hypothetical protein AMYX_05200 [Anaeromyxobacter diazotrophicus]
MTTTGWRWARAAAAAALLAFGGGASAAGRVIEVKAKRFEFSPAELRLKLGEPVTLRVTSADVTHGFYQKELGIDAEIEPGRATEVALTPTRAGRFTLICDHFCGAGHGNMRLVLVVE